MPREKFTSLLTSGGFKRHQLDGIERAVLMDAFASEALITDVLGIIDDGKEATVYCCEADPSTGFELLAAKVYRAQRFTAICRRTTCCGGKAGPGAAINAAGSGAEGRLKISQCDWWRALGPALRRVC